jgi:surface polysaccharide O-acyltransferase-like enzyme
MQVLVPRSAKPNYAFVDSVRFWSMFAIIGYHCLLIFFTLKHLLPQTNMVVSTMLKFGTIGFFLISGFLMGDRVQSCRPLEYMGKRIKKVFVPWMCWFSAMFVYMFMHHHHEFGWNAGGAQLLERVLYQDLFQTPYWFVPNLLLGLSLLLLFRKYLYDVRLGAALLTINLFYSVNIYGQWIPSSHEQALLGFVFYLWLGSYAARRFEAFHGWVATTSVWMWVAMTAVAGCLALGEAEILAQRGSQDFLNTLRLSNQVFSVLAVMTLVKLGAAARPRFVDARKVTFGLYLVHPLAIEVVFRLVHAGAVRIPASVVWETPVNLMILWVFVFAAVYGLSLGVTSLLAAWPVTAWLVGAEVPNVRPVVFAAAETESWTEAGAQGIEA